jgi:hypothetical protein
MNFFHRRVCQHFQGGQTCYNRTTKSEEKEAQVLVPCGGGGGGGGGAM